MKGNNRYKTKWNDQGGTKAGLFINASVQSIELEGLHPCWLAIVNIRDDVNSVGRCIHVPMMISVSSISSIRTKYIVYMV